MSLSPEQSRLLLSQLVQVAEDAMDCDGCAALFARLAEAERAGGELTTAMKAVRRHLTQCECCAYEYETLLEALDELEPGPGGRPAGETAAG